MERDFMGLNSKDSVVVVKEETDEGCKDSAFSKGSGVQWSLSNKVSALPHFLSFNVGQEEKTTKPVSDPFASSGFKAISTADAFDTTHKRPSGEMQKFHNGQGGTHFSMTTYPVQQNPLSMHLSHNVKMVQAANQPISVSMSNPFFKTHFSSAGQNCAGAAMNQQLLGGTPVTAPHSILSSLGSVAGTTEPWFNSKSSGAPQLTIFYAGSVHVYDDISPEKAQAIMFLAGNGSTAASNMAQPGAQVQVPASKQAGGDGVLVNQPTNTPLSSALSSPISVSSHPVGHSGSGPTTNDEVMAVKPTGGLSIPINKADPPKIVTSLAATTMIPSAVPQARKASLARFLENPASGDQPLYNEDKTVVVTVNGEIYNHKQLREKLKSHQFRTGSDCEVLAHLYEEYGEEFVDMLDGMFSFVLLDTRDKSFIACRDAIGITPLYMGWGLDGSVWFASEMKALSDDCERFMSFPPGHIYSSKSGGLRRWFNPPWFPEQVPSTPYDPLVLREAFEKAVVKRLMTDVPFGVLLSGGLDSSIVAAVASRYMVESEAACQWGSQLHTFCIGLKGSPDLKAAREVADYLGTRHHEFYFTVQEGIDALEEVIYHVETYDVTTIRASTPMFLMSRKIKSLGVKMVLSGEGSDEIFGGYLYFHKAPNKEEFHQETCQKIKALHLYDCLRANKSTSAWGVEARVPFLDKEFINIAMSIDPEWKMIRPDLGRIEKWVLRNAFDDDQKPYLPKHILYRQKEQFSDGVGYSWIDGLKDHANEHVTDSMLSHASFVYPENTPATKEAYYYRTIFEKFFPKNAARSTVPGGPSVACSTAKAVEWDASWSKNPDPSGRAALGVHAAAYEEAVEAKNASVMNGLPEKIQGAAEKTATVA